MKAGDRSILVGLVLLGLLACFWFLLLAPKRERAGELERQAADLRAEVSQQEQLAAAAEVAQGEYEQNFERLVVLGQAAPTDGDMPSLLTQLSALADRSGVEFGSLTAGGDVAAAPAPAAAETTTDQNAEEGVPTAATPAAGTTPAPATETSAAQLPLGATVGPAGLGVLPYALQFEGDFFDVADLLKRVDRLVGTGKQVDVSGRLLTVNGFTMAPDEETGKLTVDLQVTSYVLPASQGLTAGATPTAPPATIPQPTTVPTSTAPTP